MKKKLALLTSLFVLALGCSGQQPASSQDKKPAASPTPAQAASPAPAAAMKGLRDRILVSSPQEVGLSGEDAKAEVWGVLMEMALPAGVGTVVSVRDGTASLYTNTGGGVLGGHSAREQAKQFVAEAAKHLARMKPVKTFPYPEVGRVRFYALTQDGVFTAEAGEEELMTERHALSTLFRAGHEVLAGLRTASERAHPVGKR